jgi:hypothetical protein
MKTILLSLAATFLTFPAAHAGVRPQKPCVPAYAPVLKQVCEVSRRCEWRTGYTPCGQCYHYQVMVVTSRGYYSDGSTRTWTRTLAA